MLEAILCAHNAGIGKWVLSAQGPSLVLLEPRLQLASRSSPSLAFLWLALYVVLQSSVVFRFSVVQALALEPTG